MGKRAFKGILNEVVGPVPVAAQQCAGEPAQPGDLLFAQSGGIGHCLPFERRLRSSHHKFPARGPATPCLPPTVPVAVAAIIAALLLTA
jgi:hypothetical protein